MRKPRAGGVVRIVTSLPYLEAILENLEGQLAQVRKVRTEGQWDGWAKEIVVANIVAQIRFVEGKLSAAEEVALKKGA